MYIGNNKAILSDHNIIPLIKVNQNTILYFYEHSSLIIFSFIKILLDIKFRIIIHNLI